MKIVQYPHPALRHVAKPLPAIDKNVRLQIGEMFDLMYEARGLALAATQVALPFQFIVMNLSADPEQRDKQEAYINPVILDRKGSIEDEEGCLSFPGLFQNVRRAKTVKVQAYNLEGQPVEIVANDLAARVFQHEIDHLHGILFIDRMGAITKLAARSSLKEFEREFRRAQERGEISPDANLKQELARLETAALMPPEPVTATAEKAPVL